MRSLTTYVEIISDDDYIALADLIRAGWDIVSLMHKTPDREDSYELRKWVK